MIKANIAPSTRAVSTDWIRLLRMIPSETALILSLMTLSRIRYVSSQFVPGTGI